MDGALTRCRRTRANGKYYKPFDKQTSNNLLLHMTLKALERRENSNIQRVSTKETKRKNLSNTIMYAVQEKRRPGSKGVVKSSQPNAQIQR